MAQSESGSPKLPLKGVVKWFNDAKGFGFIEHESGRDVFVHYSVIEQEGFKTLKDGEAVEYELREGDKGLNASRVFRVNFDPSTETATIDNDSSEESADSQLAEQVQVESVVEDDANVTVPGEAVPIDSNQPDTRENQG